MHPSGAFFLKFLKKILNGVYKMAPSLEDHFKYILF